MYLDKITLDEDILPNKYAMAIIGKLTDTDRIILRNTLNQYDDSKEYVGECHIEKIYFHDMSKGLRATYDVKESTAILFFKNGFLVNKLGGPSNLFISGNCLREIIISDLGIIL